MNERVIEGQRNLFYLTVPSKALASSSPYFEAFDAAGVEVMFVYNDMDEFVMQNIGSFDGKTILNIETNEASAALKTFAEDADKKDEEEDSGDKLLETEVNAVTEWMAGVLSEQASSVKAADAGRMVSSPAMITNHDSASARRWQQSKNTQAICRCWCFLVNSLTHCV